MGAVLRSFASVTSVNNIADLRACLQISRLSLTVGVGMVKEKTSLLPKPCTQRTRTFIRKCFAAHDSRFRERAGNTDKNFSCTACRLVKLAYGARVCPGLPVRRQCSSGRF